MYITFLRKSAYSTGTIAMFWIRLEQSTDNSFNIFEACLVYTHKQANLSV
jgi:hypothetical protein